MINKRWFLSGYFTVFGVTSIDGTNKTFEYNNISFLAGFLLSI